MFRHALIPATRYYRGFFNNVFEEGFRELQRLERQLGQLQGIESELWSQKDPTKGLKFRCSVAGYNPEELKVDIKGDQLVIQGEHKSASDGQSLQRSFTRLFTLPPDTDKEAIQCSLNEKGQLEILAPRIQSQEPTKSIPINVQYAKIEATPASNDKSQSSTST